MIHFFLLCFWLFNYSMYCTFFLKLFAVFHIELFQHFITYYRNYNVQTSNLKIWSILYRALRIHITYEYLTIGIFIFFFTLYRIFFLEFIFLECYNLIHHSLTIYIQQVPRTRRNQLYNLQIQWFFFYFFFLILTGLPISWRAWSFVDLNRSGLKIFKISKSTQEFGLF